jgi:hypothetical protein
LKDEGWYKSGKNFIAGVSGLSCVKTLELSLNYVSEFKLSSRPPDESFSELKGEFSS